MSGNSFRAVLSIIVVITMMMILMQSVSGQLTATPNPFTVTNSTIDVGQISYFNTIISGGTAPYTGNWLFKSANTLNVSSGNTLASPVLASGLLYLVANAQTNHLLDFTYNGVSMTLLSGGTHTIYGTWTFNAFAEDSLLSPLTSTVTTLGNTLTINPQLTGTPTAALQATKYDEGQAFSLTCAAGTVTGGTQYGGTYFFQNLIYNAISGALVYGVLNSRHLQL